MARSGMPHRTARAIGDHGEQIAVDHLSARGVQIVERNWRCNLGEIDIIGIDGETLVFYEVKTRRSARFGSPAEAVTRAKAARLRQLAGRWMNAHVHHAPLVRIDVLALTMDDQGAHVEHLQGVS
ncbi:MAG: YraN family protein [Ornithinimicrobium sp.]